MSDSVVGIATAYELDGPGFESQRGQETFCLSKDSTPVLELTLTPNLMQWLSGSLACVKRPEREADHLPPPVARFKNEWSSTSAPPSYAFMT
jgi:hypothetical protein